MDFPTVLAPTAYHKLMHPEAATAHGAGAAGTAGVEQVVKICARSLWRRWRCAARDPGHISIISYKQECRLTDLNRPSVFSEHRHLRPSFKFLHSFVRDLSRSIKKDGRA